MSSSRESDVLRCNCCQRAQQDVPFMIRHDEQDTSLNLCSYCIGDLIVKKSGKAILPLFLSDVSPQIEKLAAEKGVSPSTLLYQITADYVGYENIR